jgi:hypothetical protein
MGKQFGLNVPASIFSIIIFSLAACKGTSSTPLPSDSSAVVVKDSAAAVDLPNYNLSGYLDTLWIDVNSFLAIKQRVTFRFYIVNSKTLTLRGWSKEDSVYNNAGPSIILNNGRTSSKARFGADNYFGNLQLARADVKAIKDLIKSSSPAPTYVLFAPDLTSNNAGQINYIIYLTTDDPHPLITVKTPFTAPVPTGVNTNPSPPRNGVQ